VLVTGASRGVGRETALQYARAGASVAIVARTTDALTETHDMIAAATAAHGGREADVLVLTADVRDIENARDAVRSVLQRFGKLDILIANAGAVTSFMPSKLISPLYPPHFLLYPIHLMFILCYKSKCWTRRTPMRGGTHLRSTFVASSTSSGNKTFLLSGGGHNRHILMSSEPPRT